jgi:DNA-binding NarL/FixJ family response regulator
MKVLIIEDNKSIQFLFASGLTQAGYEVYGASSVEEAQTVLVENRFEAVLLDLQLGGLSGLEVMRWLKARWPETQVIIITGYPSLDSAIEAVRQDAFDYLLKPVGIEDILACLERAIPRKADQAATTPPLTISKPAGMDALPGTIPIPETGQTLTRRELEVLGLVANGLTNARIARQLYISRNTVKTHLKHILHKFQVSSRAHAVARAKELNLL